MKQVFYLFCLTRAGLLPETQMPGLTEDSTLFFESFPDGIAAVVCEVPLDQFYGQEAESRLQDLAWVGPRAVRHNDVIQHVMQYSPVLPTRFGTLFSSRESLHRLVQHNAADITRFLDYVADKHEWAVIGLASKSRVRDRLIAERLAEKSETMEGLSPGLRYFKEKQLKADAEKQMMQWLKQVMATAAGPLTECSADWRRREMVLGIQENKDKVSTWAFLVNHGISDHFKMRIDQVNDEYNPSGVFLELSGPWPPYSFCPTLKMEPDE